MPTQTARLSPGPCEAGQFRCRVRRDSYELVQHYYYEIDDNWVSVARAYRDSCELVSNGEFESDLFGM